MRPPFPWNGAKTRMIPVLTPYIHRWGGRGRWLEPFCGSGIVSRLVRGIHPQVPQIIGDLNPWLMAAQEYWLPGRVAPPTPEDATPDRVHFYRALTDKDFASLSDRDRALRFMLCFYSAWGNRWQTHEDGSFATPINTAREGGDSAFLLRRLHESFGSGWLGPNDTFLHGNWLKVAEQALPGDLVFLDPPYPEKAGYGSTKWDLEDWSLMYDWVRSKAIPTGVHVLVCNPGTLHLLWNYVMERHEMHHMPNQGRSTQSRFEYVGYHGPWEELEILDVWDLLGLNQ